MQEHIKKLVQEFIKKIKAEIPTKEKLVICHEYCKLENTYIIYHNYKDSRNSRFLEIIAENMSKYFYENNIFNVAFTYKDFKEDRRKLIKELNSNVITEEFLQECKEASKLIKPINAATEITDPNIIKDIKDSLFTPPTQSAIERNRRALEMLRRARREMGK